MKKALVSVVLGAAVFGAGAVAAIALAGPTAPPMTTSSDLGNDRRGDTDTAPECPPGYGGDPCVHNGGGHGNCDDNQGNGSNGNDNGNFRPCPPAATVAPTSTQSAMATTAPTTTLSAPTDRK